ncbi:MAG: hypothetical protein WD960_09030 [Gemmatimonadota bacterium]
MIGVPLDGADVVRMGGAGDGPSEFRRLSRVWRAGPGGVGAFDHARQRYVEFSEAGELVRDFQLTGGSEAGDLPSLYRVGGAADEPAFFHALVTSFPREPTSGPYRGRGPLVRIEDTPDTIAWLAGNTTFVAGQMAGYVLFGATSHVSEGGEGVWVGDSERPEVVLWADGDEPVWIVRWNGAGPEPVTASRQNALWDRMEGSAPEGGVAMMAQLRDAIPFAETVPAFGTLLASPEDLVWVGEYIDPEYDMLEEPPPAQEWLVVDVAAESAATIQTPAGLRVLRVGRDFVAGVLGVESVRLYRIEFDRRDEGEE